ncbi:MAG: DNA polymerase III subunit alpha, partial [Deltaproteobacteria bacterium]|nr:DNA polymerase III subunit alpha [Deltaproteobacteria bacterium]
TSVHAAGLVISDGDMTDYVPVYTTDGSSYITQYEMKPTEKVGLVKFDFLGLKTLTVIDKAVRMVRDRLQPDLTISDIPMDDEKVFSLLSYGHTVGVFQCESGGMTQLIRKLRPSSFEDVVALVALFRPGPLGSGMVDDFVERKHGRQEIVYPHPLLEPILKDTYGMILYQEQVQKIAATLARYSLGEADLLRRAMGKKIPEEMARQKSRFVDGSVENGLEQKLAEDIFELMAEFAKYGFNKSHSAAYGLVSYQTAWLKAHYPEEFLAASMTCDMDHTDKIVRYTEECRQLGFEILPPDINRSLSTFDVPEKGKLGFALAAIKGVGETVLQLLISERQKQGPFSDLVDLARRVHLGKVGKKTLQLLTAAGAMDAFGFRRRDLDAVIPAIVDFSVQCHEANSAGQRSLFSLGTDAVTERGAPWELTLKPARKTWDIVDLFSEKKLLGLFLSGHPLDFYSMDVRHFGVGVGDLRKRVMSLPAPTAASGRGTGRGGGLPFNLVALLTAVNYRRTKKGALMASLRLEERGAAVEGVMFEKQLTGVTLPEVDHPVLVRGQAEMGEDGQMRLSIASLSSLEELRQERVRAVCVTLSSSVADEISPEVFSGQLKQLFEQYQGSCPLRLKIEFPSARVALRETKIAVELSSGFFRDLDQLTSGTHQVDYALHV